jgi:pimeloyl-ACP methyl ester carboxylesterase
LVTIKAHGRTILSTSCYSYGVQKKIIINGNAISYLDKGSGRPLLCLHGWLGDSTTYEKLSAELHGWRVVAPDLPSFGSSDDDPSVITVDDYSAFLAEFVAKIELDDYCLLGHSMGGQIALHACATRKITPNRLVLVASAGVRNTDKTLKRALRISAKILSPITPSSLKKYVYRKIGSDYGDHLSDNHKKIIDSVLSYDVREDAKSVVQPTLLIYGSADSSTPVKHGELLRDALPDARLVIIEGEDHWVHQNSPDVVAGYVQDFVKDGFA